MFMELRRFLLLRLFPSLMTFLCISSLKCMMKDSWMVASDFSPQKRTLQELMLWMMVMILPGQQGQFSHCASTMSPILNCMRLQMSILIIAAQFQITPSINLTQFMDIHSLVRMDKYSDFMSQMKRQISSTNKDCKSGAGKEGGNVIKLDDDSKPDKMDEEVPEGRKRAGMKFGSLKDLAKKQAIFGYPGDLIKREEGAGGNKQIKMESGFTYNPQSLQKSSIVKRGEISGLTWTNPLSVQKLSNPQQGHIQVNVSSEKKVKAEADFNKPQFSIIKKENNIRPNSSINVQDVKEVAALKVIKQEQTHQKTKKSSKKEEKSKKKMQKQTNKILHKQLNKQVNKTMQKQAKIQPNWEMFRCVCGFQSSGSYHLFNHIKENHMKHSPEDLVVLAENYRIQSMLSRPVEEKPAHRIPSPKVQTKTRASKEGKKERKKPANLLMNQSVEIVNQESKLKEAEKGNKARKASKPRKTSKGSQEKKERKDSNTK